MVNRKAGILLCGTILLVCSSCIKQPEAGFTYQPQKNPEAGDEISFYNESLEAIDYYWDFGNGKASEKENPTVVYEKPGDYKVTLLAENKRRSDSHEQTILINPPTILDVYCYGSKGGPLVSSWVRIWRSYEDALQSEAPIKSCVTDAYGRARFVNLDARTYYIYLRKEVEGGIYEGGGDLGPLYLNKTNVYSALINYFPGKANEINDNPGSREAESLACKKPDQEGISK